MAQDIYISLISGISMCETYNISSEQIAVRWLGYAASNGYDEVTYERLLSLEKELKLDKNIHKDDEEDDDIEMSEIGNDVYPLLF